MKLDEFATLFIVVLVLVLFAGAFLFAAVMMVDSISIKNVGLESVPCLDKNNRPFENEMCTKTVTCSWLGAAGDKKCAEVEAHE